MNKKYQIAVEDSLSRKTVVVETKNKEVYDSFRRTNWNIEKNDKKHSANSIPFSNLIVGKDGDFENFHEFICKDNDPYIIIEKKEKSNALNKALLKLSDEERTLISMLFYQDIDAKEIAELLNITKSGLSKRKDRLLKKLKKLIIL